MFPMIKISLLAILLFSIMSCDKNTNFINPDSTLPMVLSVFPANNTVNISLSSDVQIVFSEAIDPASVDSQTIGITPLITGNFEVKGDTLYFRADGELQIDTMYKVRISKNIKDAAGNGMSSDYVFSFKTAAADAQYRVTFESIWSAVTHPDSFPANPHYSDLIGATHSDAVSFWSPGQLASPGIKNMAERGRKDPLDAEVNAAIQNGTAEFLLSGNGIGLSPGMVELDFNISYQFPFVSLVSMLAPSPDWFIGVHDFNLFAGKHWNDNVEVELFVYDAGTDSGVNYTSQNVPTNPAENIFQISGFPFLVNGSVKSVGTFKFIRQ